MRGRASLVVEPESGPIAYRGPLRAVVLDWAGTTVDFGSLAPVGAVESAFAEARVPVTPVEARQPMGRAKRDHLAEVLAMPRVADAWRSEYGRAPNDADIDRLLSCFLALQAATIRGLSALIPGAVESVERCRQRGLRIGSTTGYTSDLLRGVAEDAAAQGYAPEVALCCDDVSPGRPAPWLVMECAKRLGVFPMAAVVVVDDSRPGIEAGRAAGAWAVAVAASGTEVGLSQAHLATLSPSEREKLLSVARSRLIESGAHMVIDTIAELGSAIERIQNGLQQGRRP